MIRIDSVQAAGDCIHCCRAIIISDAHSGCVLAEQLADSGPDLIAGLRA